MNLISICFIHFSSLLSLLFYFFINIQGAVWGGADGKGFIFLALHCAGSFSLFLYFFLKRKKLKIKINWSVIFFILFFLYFCMMGLIGANFNFAWVKSFTVGTTGGLFIFLSLGFFISLNTYELIININRIKRVNVINRYFFLFSLFVSFMLSILLLDSYQNLRQDRDIYLLISDKFYQRAGDFLVIYFMIYSFMLVNIMRVNLEKKFYSYIMFACYFFNNFMAIILAQMIGSNNATICLLGIMVSLLMFFYLNSNKNNLSLLKLSTWYSILKSVFFTLVTLFIGFIFCYYLFDINFEQWRIFGFSDGYISSISTRYELLSNFRYHISFINPLWGDVLVDHLTTGEGTYIHSFLISLFTHLGVIGVFLFLLYFLFVVMNVIKPYSDKYMMFNIIKVYIFILIIGLFLIANFATFFSWIPLWFLFGVSMYNIHDL